MKKVWHKKNPDALQKLRDDVAREFPDLAVAVDGEIVFLRGDFPVVHEHEELDRYQIELEVPRDFPDVVPILRETGGRIPKEPTSHVSQTTGAACPIVPEEWLLNADRDSVVSFLKGPVRNYFIGQSLVREGDPWPSGERSHGKQGLIESYEELLGVSGPDVVTRYLQCLSREGLKGHWECPCGGGKRLRDCHLEELRSLREKMTPRIAQRALQRLANPSLSV